MVAEDRDVVAFLDLRQFHPGHVLVVPRAHVADIRSVDDDTASAVMRMTTHVSRAVAQRFPADGLSVWHSAGAGAGQEVPHLHVHVHPRVAGDGMFQVYPSSPNHPDRAQLEAWAAELRAAMTAVG